MKLPNKITCEGGDVTLAIAHYLENNHDVKLEGNLLRKNINPVGDYFHLEGRDNIISISERPTGPFAYWNNQVPASGKGFKSLQEFVKSLKAPSWKIGCRTVEAREDHLFIVEDSIKVDKSTLEEMLAALK